MKPFNLEKALAGEPVILRNGNKAFVKFEIPNEFNSDEYCKVVGFRLNDENSAVKLDWNKEGRYYSHSEYGFDIIGMWQEPRPRVQLDLPAPLKEPREGMWLLDSNGISISCYTSSTHHNWMDVNKNTLSSGFFFATKKDAQEWVDAMRNARR